MTRPILNIFALAAIAGPTYAVDTFTVHPDPGMADFTSVVDAVTSPSVGDGDTVRVHAGTYPGIIVLSKKILLESVDGAESTVLDGEGVGTVLTIESGATVRGFEITGGGGFVPYGGVHITSTDRATLRECRIVENHPVGDTLLPAGGVGVDTSASALLVANVIESNTSLSVGGLVAGPFANVDLVGNWIRGNGGAGTPTGGVLFGASGRLVNNQITGNLGSGVGGLYIAGGLGPAPEGAVVDVVNCTIYGNRGTFPGGSAGGLVLDDGGAITIANTLIYDNAGSPIADLGTLSGFWDKGTLDLSHSHVKFPSMDIPPGIAMVPGFLLPGLVAPVIAPPTAPTAFGDYHLTPSSPEIGAGDTSAFPEDASAGDLGGVLRVLGGSIDVGAYEYGTSCGAPVYYGLAKVASSGESPALIAKGEPAYTGSGFHLELRRAAASSYCTLLSGPSSAYRFLLGGTVWVEPSVSVLRLVSTNPVGSARFRVRIGAPMVGTTRYYQAWFRDPGHPDGTAAGWSNAVAVTFCP